MSIVLFFYLNCNRILEISKGVNLYYVAHKCLQVAHLLPKGCGIVDISVGTYQR